VNQEDGTVNAPDSSGGASQATATGLTTKTA